MPGGGSFQLSLLLNWEVDVVQPSLERRSLLAGAATLGIGDLLLAGGVCAQAAAPQGCVLAPAGGEHLIHFRDSGNIFIKVEPAKGSENFAMGTQQLPAGGGIPIHRHLKMDEAFYVLEGSGTFILDDVRHPIEKGATTFIPKNAWHGFANPDQELLLLWVMAPAGLDGFFRETCSPPGAPSKQVTRELRDEIARKYATEFR
jgi:quercetin dioxygenase-like cupin family protein